MNIAFYGRYSSDNQRETSIEDQRRIVARWAQSRSHTIVQEFTDYATSAANLRMLTGLKQALQAATATPTPFDALVVDQLSRLSRDVGDTDAIVKQLKFLDIRIIAINDGIDTADETTKISVTVKSLVNELFLDDLRKTTKRGLDGRFLKGYSTGGRTYGYRSEPIHDAAGRTDPHGNPIPVGYRLRIDEAEATIVREIFRLFGEGSCEKTIAKELNRRYPGQTWRANTIYMMLRNSKYVGRFTFNRREWRKNPQTGRRVYRWRPKEQWERQVFETLWIVDEATWEKAQARIQTRRHLFSDGKRRTRHLLSGLLFCHRCGGRYSIIGQDYYGCRNHFESETCANDLRIRREAIETIVIAVLAENLPGWLETIKAAATRRQVLPPAEGAAQTQQRLNVLRQQAEAIMAVVRSGRLTGRALDETLATYQQLWNQVEALEPDAQPAPVTNHVRGLRYDPVVVQHWVDALPTALRDNVLLGREVLTEMFQHVRIGDEERLTPQCPICRQVIGKVNPQHFQRHGLTLAEVYKAFPVLGFTKKARLQVQPSPSGILKTLQVYCSVVAGAGFEPATFGL